MTNQQTDSASVRDIPGNREIIRVGHGILPELGSELRALGIRGRAHVVSDDRVAALHGEKILRSLADVGFEPDLIAVPPREESKSLDQAARLYSWLADRRAERADVVVGLGGGLVGDLAGFVAATYLRGLALVHVPTTLLAQIDSSIGGKTGVNLPRGKNLVGAFYPSLLSFMDVQLLSTLSPREISSGWAEGIKYGFILDPDLIDVLERDADELIRLEPFHSTPIIERCANHKVQIVAEDPRERGRRIILNFGHTIAHAIESATSYQRFLHGEAVAIGMIGAARIAERIGVGKSGVLDRLVNLVQRYGLPTSAPGIAPAHILDGISLDKKVEGRSVRWVLVEEPGQTRVERDVPLTVVNEVISDLVRSVDI
jgi:3-dehydroquinate synthase